MSRPSTRIPRIALALFACVLGPPAPAQIAWDTNEPQVTAEFVEKRIAGLKDSGPESGLRDKLLNVYRRALANIEKAQTDRAAAARFADDRENAAAEAERIKQQLERRLATPPALDIGVTADSSAREVELRYQQEKANEAAVKAKLVQLDQQIELEHQRPVDARKRLVAATEESNRLSMDRTEAPVVGEASDLVDARNLLLRTRADALSAEIAMLDQALLSQPQRLSLLEAQHQDTSIALQRIQERLETLKALLSARRRTETQEIVANADVEALARVPQVPGLNALIEDNRRLADELLELTTALEGIDEQRDRMQRLLDDIESRRERTQFQLGTASAGGELGFVLLAQWRDLPESADYRVEARERAALLEKARVREIRLQEQARQLADPKRYAARLLEDLPANRRSELRGPITRLVSGHRTLLQHTQERNAEYLRALSSLEFDRSRLLNLLDEYRTFLTQRLLWVRGKEPLNIDDLAVLPREFADLFSFSNGRDVALALVYAVTHSPLQMAGILVTLLYLRRWRALRRALHTTGELQAPGGADTMRHTFKAVVLSLLIAAPWPLLVGITGYSLSLSPVGGGLVSALGFALLRVSPMLFMLRTFRAFCLGRGVAELHFGWSGPALARVRSQLDLLLATFVLPAVIAVTNIRRSAESNASALSQLMFVVGALGIAVFAYRLFSLRGGIVRTLRTSGGNVDRSTRWRIELAAGILLPVGAAGLAGAGYVYSAATVCLNLINTFWLLFGYTFLWEMGTRWLLVVKRRLVHAQRAAEVAHESSEPGEHPTVASAERVSLDADTQLLLKVALLALATFTALAIWSNLLPAFTYFDSIKLWYRTTIVDGVEQPVPVSVVDLGAIALGVLTTWIAARTLPPVVEAILRHRGHVTTGARLATSTLLRYAIVMIGTLWALDHLGMSWSRLQWLVAALGVGIGFGVQEIVANVLCGVIILLERPVRIGDVVSVGDATGTVTRVRLRATTLRNWDQQELLVPNKEFITGRVLNWSLSDENIRIFFRVGIAYGSDVKRALTLLAEAIDEHPLTLRDPAPLVTFEGFGDNALTLGVRCYIPTLNKRLETITDLNLAIERKFREAGIVIAFPQRDVHLDTSRPLEIHVTRTTRDQGGRAS